MKYTSNWIFDHFDIPSKFNFAEIVLVDNSEFLNKIHYYRLGVEEGEESILIYDNIYDESFRIKQAALLKNRKFLVRRGLHDYEIIDRLPKKERLCSMGASSSYDLENGINWGTRVRNVLYDLLGFYFQDPTRIEYGFDSRTGWYDKEYYYNDSEVEAENESEREKLHCVRIFLADHGAMIYHGIRIEDETEFKTNVSLLFDNGGKFVSVPLLYSKYDDNISTEDDIDYFDIIEENKEDDSLFKMDQFFISVDKQIKEKYPLSIVEPLTLHYNHIFYDIKSTNNDEHTIVRYGKDDNIYEIKKSSTISYVNRLRDNVYYKHLVNVIKYRCQEFYGYTIGASEYQSLCGIIHIPTSKTEIEDFEFSHKTAITSIILPDSIKTIGNWAFDRCTLLESITLPDSITKLGDGIFAGCI